MKVLKWKKAPRKITMALHLITEHDLQQLRRRCDPGPEVWCPFRSRSSRVSTLLFNVFIFSVASSLASQLHSQNNHLVNFLSVGILNRFISIWIICFILCILRHSKASFREGSKYFFSSETAENWLKPNSSTSRVTGLRACNVFKSFTNQIWQRFRRFGPRDSMEKIVSIFP